MFVGVRTISPQHQLEDLRQTFVVGVIEENMTVLKGYEMWTTVQSERTDADRSLLNVLWLQTNHENWTPRGNSPSRGCRQDLMAGGRP